MSIPANVAARESVKQVIELIDGELRQLIDQHGLAAVAPFFEILRDCYGERLTIRVMPEPVEIKPMLDQEAREFGQQSMPWGQHKGKSIDEVPLAYLDWCINQPDTFRKQLERYLASRRLQPEVEQWSWERSCEDEPSEE